MTALTWQELLDTCSRLHSVGKEQMLNIFIKPPLSEQQVSATVVPTRMHEPGFYVRAISGTPIWASWMLRSDEDLAMFKRFVDLGLVTKCE